MFFLANLYWDNTYSDSDSMLYRSVIISKNALSYLELLLKLRSLKRKSFEKSSCPVSATVSNSLHNANSST